jgi:hypothetical protein
VLAGAGNILGESRLISASIAVFVSRKSASVRDSPKAKQHRSLARLLLHSLAGVNRKTELSGALTKVR